MNTIFFRSIYKKLICFLALLLAAALGTSVFLCLNTLTPAVKQSLNNYLKNSNLMDVKLTSAVGFSSADVSAVSKLDSVNAVMPVKTANVILNSNNKQIVLSNGRSATAVLSSVDAENFENKTPNKNYINRLNLVLGSYPKSSNECVINSDALKIKGIKIGNTITLMGDGENINSKLKSTSLKIVGAVNVPTCISKNFSNETVGSGDLSAYIFVPETLFSTTDYSEIYVKLKGLENYNYSGKKYFDSVQKFSESASSLGASRLDSRIEKVSAIAQKQADKDMAELNTYQAKYSKVLSSLKSQLTELKDYNEHSSELLAAKQAQIDNSMTDSQKELLAKQSEYSENYDKYMAELKQYKADKAALEKEKQSYEGKDVEINDKISAQFEVVEAAELKIQIAEDKVLLCKDVIEGLDDPAKMPDFEVIILNISSSNFDLEFIKQLQQAAEDSTGILARVAMVQKQSEYAAATNECSSAMTTLSTYKSELDAYNKKMSEFKIREQALEKQNKEIKKKRAKMISDNNYLLKGENALSDKSLSLEEELAALQVEVANAAQKYTETKLKYITYKEQGISKIDNMNRSIESNIALSQMANTATWDTSDVRSINGYSQLDETVATVKKVSAVPAYIALILTVALSVAVMYRYAVSQEEILGKLRLLGHSTKSISFFALQAFIPTQFFAWLLSIMAATYLLPTGVKKILDARFNIPEVTAKVELKYLLISAVAVIIVTMVVSVFAVSVLTSACPRNKIIFRNRKPSKLSAKRKKIIISEVVVFALSMILTVNTLASYFSGDTQKNYTANYQASAGLVYPVDYEDETIFYDKNIRSTLFAEKISIHTEPEYNIFVLSNSEKFGQFINTKQRITQNGVIITEKLSKELGAKVGRKISITLPTGSKAVVTVMGITSDTTENSMYMSGEYFENNFCENRLYNCVFLQFTKNGTPDSDIAQELIKSASVNKIVLTQKTLQQLEQNRNTANTVLISTCAVSVLWTVLNMLSVCVADMEIKRKKKK